MEIIDSFISSSIATWDASESSTLHAVCGENVRHCKNPLRSKQVNKNVRQYQTEECAHTAARAYIESLHMWQREKPEIGGKCVIKSNRVKNSFKSLCVHEYKKKKSLANCWSESYAHFSCVFRMKNYRVLAAPIVGGDCMYFFFLFSFEGVC